MTHIDHELLARLKWWRRHLHEHPEVSGKEMGTSAFVRERLIELGIPHVGGVGGTGVVATLKRGESNRSVGLRADMDALPIAEANAFAHASRNPGVMHACGHDGHTACLLGAAAALARDESWSGTVHFVFQPAEENGEGAKAMIADQLFERFPMERLFACHNWPGLEAGVVAVHNGPSMAAGGDWRVTLRGIAGHAAMPHATRDPVLAAGHLIVALHSIVSRNVDPLDTVVLTVSSVNGGLVSNQIPEIVELVGTLRTFNAEIRKMVIQRMSDVIEGTAKSFGVEADYKINSTGRVMADTPEESRLAILAAETGGLRVTRDIRPAMGGDDFAFLVENRGGAYVLIGNGPVIDGGKLHNERYDFNDEIIAPAVTWLSTVAKMALTE
ncbi:amidohydrolase [Inquilinus sp. CA228]|uniref:amidohydrolase n=1 Tax=Inquilinus sp. CA228 TaxID=3455609 RepID=UPI003F8D3FA0